MDRDEIDLHPSARRFHLSIIGIPDFEAPFGLPYSDVLSNTSVTLCPGVPTPVGTRLRVDSHNKGLCYFTQALPCRVDGILL